MKKIILVIFPIVLIVGIFYYMQIKNMSPTDKENIAKVPLEIKDNKIQDPQCHMYLVGKKFTTQSITKDNKTHFFDDPGCMVLWLETQKIDINSTVSWVYTLDTKRWINYKKAHYSIDEFTPMHYGFGAYEKDAKSLISFDEMRLKMLRGENMTNPKIRKKILSHINN